MARKVHRLFALTTTALLALVTPVDAKPVIAVTASFDRYDDFAYKLEEDLARSTGLTPQQFVAQQFIDAFQPLGIFTFKRGPVPSAIALTLSVSSGRGEQRWPAADVELTISVTNSRPLRMTLFQRAHCGRPPCSPQSLVDPAWYQHAFARLIQQWPNGLLQLPARDRRSAGA